MPDASPVTFPNGSTVAVNVAPLLHVPPDDSISPMVPLKHTLFGPEIGDGDGVTFTNAELLQVGPTLYTMLVVPPPIAVNTPVAGSIVPTPGTELVHVPPLEASVKVV